MATDDMVQAEDIIKSVMVGQVATKKTMEICRWLFSFNDQEKTHRIKCYMRNDKSIRFCFDRGGDCEGSKIRTIFITIRSDFTIIFRLTKIDFTYLRSDGEYYRINGIDARSLPMEELQLHILDAYCKKLKNPEFMLDSVYCSNDKIIDKAPKPTRKTIIHSNDTFLPTKTDVEFAESQLRQSPDEVISIGAVLDQVEINFKKTKKLLKENWRFITKRNIENWFSKNEMG